MPARLTKAVIDRADPKESDYFLWDAELKGFGIKIAKGGRRSYVCKYRVGSGRTAPTRRMTLGAHGSPWTVDQARAEARRILGRVANGEDPAKDKQDARKQITVAELCDLYVEQGCATKKASTLVTDKGRIERHIKPLLGRKKVPDVSRADIKRFLQDVANGKTAADIKTGLHGRAIVRGGKGTATRTVGLLGGIFSFAFDCGLINDNPVRGVKRFSDRKGQRYLSQQELVALGKALRDAAEADENPFTPRIERHIKPLLGRKKVPDVSRADIKRFLQDVANGKTAADIKTGLHGRAIVRGGKGTATRTVGLLGGIFSFAFDCGLINDNPVRGVKRFSDRKGQRYLSQQELVALGKALRDAAEADENPFAIAILKLLIFTGARKSEIEALKWSEIDFQSGYMRLADSKTGQKAVPLNAGALEVLSGLPRLERSEFVFPSHRGERHYEGTPKVWKRIRALAGLEGVRLMPVHWKC